MADGDPAAFNGSSVELKPIAEPDNDSAQQKSTFSPKTAKNLRSDYFKLYRYADRTDKILVTIGVIASCLNGLSLPAFAVAFGEVLDEVGETDVGNVNDAVLLFVYLGIASFILGWLELTTWMITGMRQSNRVRAIYLKSMLCQDIEFFDLQPDAGGLLQGLNEDTAAFQNGINEKAGNFLHHIVSFIAGISVGLWRGWDMALVMMAMLPLLAACGAAVVIVSSRLAQASAAAYAEANGIALSTFNNIRTVAAFGGEQKALSSYTARLDRPSRAGITEGLVRGLNVGLVFMTFFNTYALALWYGGKRVRDDDYTGGQVATVLFTVIIGGFALGQGVPYLNYFVDGAAAGSRIFGIIDRKPAIDVRVADGQELAEVKGELRFEGVHFAYPARPDATIFNGFDLLIKPGQATALVGSSGSGKSTVVQLIERFYDPASGRVLLDGHDLRSLSLAWLRSQIGLVSQEPTLFASTLFYNIAIAKQGASRSEVEAAAKAANAHKFISKLPLGYETLAGEGGVQLSGGQKQRIAIARAVLKNPKILLLDEATSALDAKSEKVVQGALEGIMTGSRTTVIIAHRLSTVQNADRIAVLSDGKVVEQGGHEELVALNGAYNTLLRLQREAAEKQGLLEATESAHLEAVDLEEDEVSDDSMESGSSSEVKKGELAASEATDKDDKAKVGFSRLLDYNRPGDTEMLAELCMGATAEWAWMTVGVLTSVVTGSMMPTFGVILPKILATLYRDDVDEMEDKVRVYTVTLVLLSVVMLFASTLQQYTLSRAAVALTRRLRIALMRAILYMEIGWFDKEDNASGALAARLSSDAAIIHGAMGDRLGIVMQNSISIGAGMVLSFVFSWKMALVLTAVLPLVAFAGVLQAKFMKGFDSNGGTLFAKANQTVSEAFSSIRTVTAYTMQDSLVKLYTSMLEGPAQKSIGASIHSGAAYGASLMLIFLLYALLFWFGGREVDRGNLELDNMLTAFLVVMFGMKGATQTSMFFPDMHKADSAAVRVFEVIDRPSRIDASKEEGEQPPSLKGQLELRDVTFHYPERPEVTIFSGFNLTVPASKTVALVGESGSGKSTVIGLIQRFYDPDSGNIYLDGTELRQLQLRWLRAHTGMVSQEPVLFATSILDNIRYGRQDATDEEIMDAARAANAHSFIFDMPDKYQTNVGQQGTQLSGGQKQRVAIARAVLRDPRVLLLDEATSALDATSERLVQEALNQLMQQRTTLIIAHRLSTVRGADSIAVMQSGKILEMGTHEQLLENPKGAYSQLMHAQLASG